MVLESNTLDYIFLQDGENGVGTPGKDGKTLYTWVKYSQNADGSNMSDSPENALYIGIAYNKDSATESMNANDYNWTKIKGEQGLPGADAYTIILSNESHTFSGTVTSAIASSTKCYIIAYKGTKQLSVTIGTISNLPEGMTAPISNNGTTNAYFSPTVTSLMTTKNGTLTIPITVDGKTFTKYFSYSLALQGNNGISATNIILSNESHTFSANASGQADATSINIDILGFTGTTQVRTQIGELSGLPTGMTMKINNNGTTNTSITVSVTSSLIISQGTVKIPITADGITVEKSFSYALSRTGETGAQGKGIKSVTNYYLATSSSSGVTTSTSGWTTNIQSITSSKRYLWNYEIITYTDNTTSTTTPVIIGVWGNTGSTGETGKGIKSITEYYLASSASSGVTTSTSGWSTSMQTTTTTNKYLWNYEKITYTDDTTSNSTVRIIGTHGDTGAAGRVYELSVSTLVIKKGADNALSPSIVTFSGHYRDGNSATRSAYSGRFKIEESTDGNTFTTKYTSSANEASKSYTPSSSNVKVIRCTLYASGGTTNALDVQSVVVLTDIANLEIGGRNYLEDTSTPNSIKATNTDSFHAGAIYYTVGKKKLSELGFNVGDVVTVSLDWEVTDTTTYGFFFFEWYGNDDNTYITRASKDNYNLSSNDLSGHIVFNCTLTSDMLNARSLARRIDNSALTLTLKHVKLEKGNKATDWTPAPEDIQDQFTTVTNSIKGVANDVDQVNKKIIAKVWQNDITDSINNYDGSTVKSIRDRVTSTETDISGIKTTLSDVQTTVSKKADGSTVQTLSTKFATMESNFNGFKTTVSNTYTTKDELGQSVSNISSQYTQLADKFNWIVKSGTSSSDFTITDRMISLTSSALNIDALTTFKNSAENGTSTVINGGAIKSNTITTSKLATDAIKSTNYSYSSGNFSSAGTFLDLSTGLVRSKNFAIDSSGNAYFKGNIQANAGYIGGTSGWAITTNTITGNANSKIISGILESSNYVENSTGVQVNLNTGIIKGNIEASTLAAKEAIKIYVGSTKRNVITGHLASDFFYVRIGCDLSTSDIARVKPSIILNKSTASTNVSDMITINTSALDIEANTSIVGSLSASDISTYTNGGAWISGKRSAAINILTSQSEGSFHPVLRISSYNGNVWCLGGLGDTVGIYGYYSGRTANGYDWCTTWDTSNGNLTTTNDISCNDIMTRTGWAADRLSHGQTAYSNLMSGRISFKWVQNSSGVWRIYVYVDGTLVRDW